MQHAIGSCFKLLFTSLAKHFTPEVRPYQRHALSRFDVLEELHLHNHYAWNIDLRCGDITRCLSVERVLGYNEGQFNLEKAFGIIHPDFQPIVLCSAITFYRFSQRTLREYDGRPLCYCARYPVRLANGDYHMVQQTSEIQEVDSEGRMVSHSDTFHLIHPYEGNLFNPLPTLHCRGAERAVERLTDEFVDHIQGWYLEEGDLLTNTEQDIAKRLLLENSIQQIAAERYVSVATVRAQKRNYERKCRDQFPSLELSPRQILKLLDYLGLLGY